MKNKKILILAVIAPLLICSCEKKEESKVESNGLTKEINELIPSSILSKIKNLGMPINTGDNPPNIENIYLATPCILKASNVPEDTPGHEFSDFEMSFYQQNNDKMTIKIDYENGPESGSGMGGFIVGEGNNFTVVCEVDVYNTDNNVFAKSAMIISGKYRSTGIINFYCALVMLDNYGNPKGNFINNGSVRIIYDSDGFSESEIGLRSSSLIRNPNQPKSTVLSIIKR